MYSCIYDARTNVLLSARDEDEENYKWPWAELGIKSSTIDEWNAAPMFRQLRCGDEVW